MSAPWKGRWEELAQHQGMVVRALKVAVSPSFLGAPNDTYKLNSKSDTQLDIVGDWEPYRDTKCEGEANGRGSSRGS
jgi:hypothetical protein